MRDASVFVGHWPFSPLSTATIASLCVALSGAGITGAAFAPVEAVLAPEPMAPNRRLFAAVSGTLPPSFTAVLTPIINPALPGWEDHVDACVREGGERVRALKIMPNYHSYSLDDPAVDSLAGTCSARGITLCIQARMLDERSHHPLMRVSGVAPAAIAAFVARHPELPVLVCGAYMSELAVFRTCPNLSVELSFVEGGYLLRTALAHLSTERLLLGTHAPIHMIATSVAKPSSDDLAPEVAARITAGNFDRFFGFSEAGPVAE